MLPLLYISIQSQEDSEPILTIYNPGNVPAYDVDLMVVGNYHEDDLDIHSFIARYVRPDQRHYDFSSDDEGFYGVYDHVYYPVFLQRRKVVAALKLVSSPDQIICLLQFRDLSGSNYSQVYWLFLRKQETDRSYRLGSIDPGSITPGPRVGFDFAHPRQLKAENGEPIPKYISDEFEGLLNHSIPSGYLSDELPEIEDRGEWHVL